MFWTKTYNYQIKGIKKTFNNNLKSYFPKKKKFWMNSAWFGQNLKLILTPYEGNVTAFKIEDDFLFLFFVISPE